MLSGSWDKTLKLWDAGTGQLIRVFEGHSDQIHSVVFSHDGARVLSGSADATLKLWEVATGRLIRTFESSSAARINSVTFSPDDAYVLSGSDDTTLKLWDATTGLLVRTFVGHSSKVRSVAFSADGVHVLSGSEDKTLKLWHAGSGGEVRTFKGHSQEVMPVAFSRDGTRALSGSADTTLNVWSVGTGDLLASKIGTRDGEWLVVTPAGFFAASPKGGELLSAVRGLEVTSIANLYDHLYRPDLVEQLLKGDPEGKYADATSKLSLQKILNSGPAPQIEEVPGRKIERVKDTIRVTLRLVDTGGGIGEKAVWRVNGVTQGDVSAPAAAAGATRSGYRVITQTLRINPSRENLIEVTAYNGAGLMATERYSIKIDRFGESAEPRPRMHVLAVGVERLCAQGLASQLPSERRQSGRRFAEGCGQGAL